MGGPEVENIILELFRRKDKSTQYIHVFPGDIKVYTLLEEGIRHREEDRGLWEVPMMECSRESLAGFRLRGTPIPVSYVELREDGTGEDVRSFLKMVRETGIIIDTGSGMYAVSYTALQKMHKQMEMYGAFDYSPIHDLMLAEKLLAVEPCRYRPAREKSLERVDKKNAKGYTLAVSTDPFEGSLFVDGMITGMYSGRYDGMEGDAVEALCRRFLGGDIIRDKEIILSEYGMTADRLEISFRIGAPFRYEVYGTAYCLSKGITVTDSSSGFKAFSIRGTVSDTETGDQIIVSEKKHNHYGFSGPGKARRSTAAEVIESRILKVWEETEAFIRLLDRCIVMPGEDARLFMEVAVSAGIRKCIGKKRTAALFGRPPASMAEALHLIIHAGSSISRTAGTRELPGQEAETLRKITAGAVREAYQALAGPGGGDGKAGKAGAPFGGTYENDTGDRQDDAEQVQADPSGRTVYRKEKG